MKRTGILWAQFLELAVKRFVSLDAWSCSGSPCVLDVMCSEAKHSRHTREKEATPH